MKQEQTQEVNSSPPPLAICSWSLKPESPEALVEKVLAIGIKRVQLHLNPLFDNPKWQLAPQKLEQAGIKVVSGMLTMTGEDYSTLETIRKTGGILPDANWQQNWTILSSGAYIARELGIQLVTFHAGFIPSMEMIKQDPQQQQIADTMIDRLSHLCKLYKRHDLLLGLETGQETADDLMHLLGELKADNLGVNFDPANMILYAKGDPIEALGKLKDHVVQLHIKDATATETPGTWGSEVPVGEGEVDWDAFMDIVLEIAQEKAIDLAIEREAGDQRVPEIQQAASYINDLLNTKSPASNHQNHEVNA